jgi:extracellular factor (EF) 3-hydroxypalmitic acid methyl ester biosynthesis protein
MERYFSLGNGSALSQTSTSLTATETTKKWIQFIDSATRELIERMKLAEQSINGGMFDHEDIQLTLKSAFDNFTVKAAHFEAEIEDKTFIKQTRIAFHQKTNDLFSKSYCFNRARTWPQGYQGDYKTLETLYRSVPQSDGLGYFLDNFSLNTTLAVAVRNRIRMLQDILKAELSKRLKPNILNIACGSCRELFEITPEIIDSKAHFTCIDHDNDALSFSQNRLYYTDALRHIDFRKYNALRLFDYEVAVQDFGPQDVIYSAGLFDYLDSDFLVKVLDSMYKLLNNDGKLIAAFKDARNYRSQKYHWFFDWDGFLQRSEEDFRDILADAQIPASKISEQRDETGAIIFYTISK